MLLQRKSRSATHLKTSAWLVAAAVFLSTGCAKPPPDLRVTEDTAVVPVKPADLGLTQEAMPPAGRSRTGATPPAGRFPAGLAVARVDVVIDPDDEQRRLRLVEMPPDRAVHWGQLFDNLPAIREVTLLGSPGLDPRGVNWADLLRESVNNECSLCVIYVVLHDTTADADMVAALWDADASVLLETFHVPVHLSDDVRKVYLKDDEVDSPNLRRAAEHRAEAELREKVRVTVWELAESNEKVPSTQPSPWRNNLPLFPRDYLPRDEALPRNLPLPFQPQGGARVRQPSAPASPRAADIPAVMPNPGFDALQRMQADGAGAIELNPAPARPSRDPAAAANQASAVVDPRAPDQSPGEPQHADAAIADDPPPRSSELETRPRPSEALDDEEDSEGFDLLDEDGVNDTESWPRAVEAPDLSSSPAEPFTTAESLPVFPLNYYRHRQPQPTN